MGLDSRDYYRPSGVGGFSFFPPIIKFLLLINVVVFVLQNISAMVYYEAPITFEDILTKLFALIPLSNGGVAIVDHGNYFGTLPASFYPWQLITYQFMHGDFTHILFNMFMLWMFGMELENLMGSKKFLLYYLLCGLGAGIVQLLFSPLLSNASAPTIGASGAVFGVMIAFAMHFPDRYILIYFLIPIKAKYLIAILIVFEFLSVREPSLVAHLAHIGGAVTGFLYLFLDRSNNFNLTNILDSFKKQRKNGFFTQGNRSRFGNKTEENVEDAKFYEIDDTNKEERDEISQAEIDKILDKISESGYQNLTEREKRILFEASKKK